MPSRARSSDTGIRPSSSQTPSVALARPGLGVRRDLQFAGDGFEQVARRHQALHHAVLVDHEHQPAGARAELLEQFHAGQRLGHEHRGLRGLLDRALVRGPEREQVRAR